MNHFTEYVFALGLLIVFDIPWLLFIRHSFGNMIQSIQKQPLTVKFTPAIVVYFAMAYLVLETSTPLQAFFVGAAVYAVYEFTNLSTINKWSAQIAIQDTLWGGILFAAVRFFINSVKEK
jgi:uncharacterized membrane protein